MRVLLVEDEPSLGEAVRDHIVAEGHAVDWLTNLGEATAAAQVMAYELILLDLHLPDGSGLDFLKARRRTGDVAPVIILTARDQVSDRIEGLNSGADDYLVKPFDLAELAARVAAVSRRYVGRPNPVVRLGEVELDLARRTATVAGRPVDLTAREWVVLDRLQRHVGGMVSKSALEDALYAFGAEVESNAVEVYVSRLRKKLGYGVIRTMRGLGYRLEG
jgi:DNA-binding response OmpR family regulator